MSRHLPVLFASLCCFAVIWIIYGQTLGFEYVWDDRQFLLATGWFRDEAHWLEKVFSPFFVSDAYFRPLTLLTFVADTRLFDTRPVFSHGLSVFLLATNTLLVITLCASLLKGHRYRWHLAVSAGLLYASHPALVETYAWVSGRFDALLTTFALATLLADRTITGRFARPVSVATLFLLAALSKEMAATLPLVVYLFQRFASNQPHTPIRKYLRSQDAHVLYAMFAAGCLYLVLRATALPSLLPTQGGRDPGHWLNHLALVLASFAEYVNLASWPFATYSPMHPVNLPVALFDPRAVAGLTYLLLITGAALISVRNRSRSWPIWLAPLASLLPVLNISMMPIGTNIVHERFLCFPLALLSIAVVTWLAKSKIWTRVRTRAIVVPGAALLVTIVGLNTLNAKAIASVWRNEFTLWTWAAKMSPDSFEALSHLVSVQFAEGRTEEAKALAESLAERGYADPSTVANYGISLVESGETREGEAALENALLNAPSGAILLKVQIQSELARAKFLLCKPDQSLSLLQAAHASDPSVVQTLRNLSAVAFVEEKFDLAASTKDQLFRQIPDRHHSEAQRDLDALISYYQHARNECERTSN